MKPLTKIQIETLLKGLIHDGFEDQTLTPVAVGEVKAAVLILADLIMASVDAKKAAER